MKRKKKSLTRKLKKLMFKANYKNIIEDKVTFEVNDSDAGPKTFEALLHRTNPSLYKYISSLRTADNKDAMILFLRSLIKALETYTNSSLAALEFKALGVENYINILKEVISYFKSYMVEFTKDEFVYMFDGLWDYGGSSNMLKLIDEISHMTLVVRPTDSLTLFDVGKFDTHIRREDGNKEGFGVFYYLMCYHFHCLISLYYIIIIKKNTCI